MTSADLQEITADREFNKEFEWRGRRLHPYSQGRKLLLIAAGLRLGGALPLTINDVIMVLYVVSVGYRELSVAQRDPDLLVQRAAEWADLNIKDEDYKAASDVAGEIIRNAYATKAAPVPEPGGEPAAPGNSPSHQNQRS